MENSIPEEQKGSLIEVLLALFGFLFFMLFIRIF